MMRISKKSRRTPVRSLRLRGPLASSIACRRARGPRIPGPSTLMALDFAIPDSEEFYLRRASMATVWVSVRSLILVEGILLDVYLRWLVVTATAYVVCHHLGLLPGGLGSAPRDTQWADWLDLLVPFLVLAPAAACLRAAGATSRTWWVFGLGAVTYATGHGVHLAANSVGNTAPGPTEHLWDEVVGHEIWYAGVAIVVVALATTMPERPRPAPIGYLLAALAGLTWASNAVGGGTEVLSVTLTLLATAYGWRHRRDLGAVLAVAGAVSGVTLLGVWIGGA
jgi:hypothetical protein